ncbi:MAG: HD-GYP domain-containing protein [Bacteriovoracia bacterium]
MSNPLNDAQFIEISPPIFRKIAGQLPFDIYLRRAEGTYTKIFPKGERVDVDRLLNYEGKIDAFYVTQPDYRQYLLYVERMATEFCTKPKSSSPDEILAIVKELTTHTMLEISIKMQVDSLSLAHASQVVRGCIEALYRDPQTLVKVFVQMSKHPYVIRHSITSAIFALLLAKAGKLESEKTLANVGMGALLHDLGMSRLSFDAEDKDDLSAQDWKDLKEHPQIGSRLLDAVKGVSTEVRTIVMQHHEQPNGLGYPNGIRDKEIFLLAKIVAIADSFSALTSKRPFRTEPCTPTKALEIMSEDRGKFDPQLLKAFTKIFVKIKT